MKRNISINELFSGIGCQRMGIQNTGLYDVEVKSTSDIDTQAVISYAAIHCGLTEDVVANYNYPSRQVMADYLSGINMGYDPQKDKPYNWQKHVNGSSTLLNKAYLACKLSNNLGDINLIKSLPYADLWTVSFCCQDLSVQGRLAGMSEGSGTRSSLLWVQMALLKDSIDRGEAPKYIMFENVKNLVSKRFMPDFQRLLDTLDEYGYNAYWEVLNAKNCGVPQQRERVFCIAVRKDIELRDFCFPKPLDNDLSINDILEKDVPDNYYINTEKAQRLVNTLIENGDLDGEL